MNKSIYLIPLILILSVFVVNAYDTTKLFSYYSFESSGNNTIYDVSGNNHNLLGSTNISLTTGIISKGIQNVNDYNSSLGNIFNSSNGYTINYWLKATANNGQYITTISNLNNSNRLSTIPQTPNNMNVYSQINFGGNIFIGVASVNNLSNYHMYTIVKITNLGITQIYVDGVLINISNISDRSNNLSTYFHIGKTDAFNTGYILDELSLWNTTLSIFDIAQLYNSGVGLSYSSTVGLNQANQSPVCIDSQTYCTHWGYSGDGSKFCNSVAESQFCSGGCTNDICYTNGVAECGILGETRCTLFSNGVSDTTSYQTCDDSNGDGYLDFKTVTSCPLSTYCVDTFHKAQCKNSSSNGVHDNYALNVVPYAISNANTTYNIDTSSRTVTVNTVFGLHSQQFYDSGVNYTSRICDYKETNIYNFGSDTITNQTKTYTLPTATSQNSIVRISISPQDLDNGTIQIFSQASTSLGILHYFRNASAKSLCLYDGTYTQIYCDYDYTGSDTLKSLDLEYTFDFSNRFYTTKMYFSRSFSNIKIRYPIVMSINDIYYIEINATNTTLNNISVVNIPLFSNFAEVGTSSIQTILNPNCDCGKGINYIDCIGYKALYGNEAYTQLCSINVNAQVFTGNCIYTSTGIFQVRTYGNNLGNPDFSVYKDYNVNIAGTGLTQNEVATKQGTGNLFGDISQTTKYIIVIVVIVALLLLCTGIGFSARNVNAGFIVGVVLDTFVIILFTVLGWISAWIIVAMIIIASATIILLSKLPNNSGSSGV